jgi:hypothetical protein
MDIPLKVKTYFRFTPRIPIGISVSFLGQVQDGGRLRVGGQGILVVVKGFAGDE